MQLGAPSTLLPPNHQVLGSLMTTKEGEKKTCKRGRMLCLPSAHFKNKQRQPYISLVRLQDMFRPAVALQKY